MSKQVKTYKAARVSRAAYAGAVGYVFVIISWFFVYEGIYLWITTAYRAFFFAEQFGGVLALTTSASYAVGGWHFVDSFYKNRREGVDYYPYKIEVTLHEDGKTARGNMLVGQDAVIPFAVFNKDLKPIARIGPDGKLSKVVNGESIPTTVTLADKTETKDAAPILDAAEKGELVSADRTPMYLGYQVHPNPEFQLFDVLGIVIPVSFNRLLGALMLEFSYRGLLVFRPLSPVSIVKIHRLIDKLNRSILIAEVGWSQYHAEMMAVNLKVASISNFDTVKMKVPMPSKDGKIEMTEIDVPTGAMIFQMMNNYEVPKLQETISSQDATIDALKHSHKAAFSDVARLASAPQEAIEAATGGKGSGRHPGRWIKDHKKISIPLILLASVITIIVVGEAVSVLVYHHP